jgi:hypothetical protein
MHPRGSVHLTSRIGAGRWRVLHRVEANVVTVYVARITPHDDGK